jgi:hypothetical protein
MEMEQNRENRGRRGSTGNKIGRIEGGIGRGVQRERDRLINEERGGESVWVGFNWERERKKNLRILCGISCEI